MVSKAYTMVKVNGGRFRGCLEETNRFPSWLEASACVEPLLSRSLKVPMLDGDTHQLLLANFEDGVASNLGLFLRHHLDLPLLPRVLSKTDRTDNSAVNTSDSTGNNVVTIRDSSDRRDRSGRRHGASRNKLKSGRAVDEPLDVVAGVGDADRRNSLWSSLYIAAHNFVRQGPHVGGLQLDEFRLSEHLKTITQHLGRALAISMVHVPVENLRVEHHLSTLELSRDLHLLAGELVDGALKGIAVVNGGIAADELLETLDEELVPEPAHVSLGVGVGVGVSSSSWRNSGIAFNGTNAIVDCEVLHDLGDLVAPFLGPLTVTKVGYKVLCGQCAGIGYLHVVHVWSVYVWQVHVWSVPVWSVYVWLVDVWLVSLTPRYCQDKDGVLSRFVWTSEG